MVLDQLGLNQAIADVPITVQQAANGHRRSAVSVLKVLPSGPIATDPGDFAGSGAVRTVLTALREQADFVLIDTPPLLGVGETAALGAIVDGIILVTRLGVTSRPLLRETRRILDSTPAAKLGFVITEAGREEGEYRSRGYDYYYRSHPADGGCPGVNLPAWSTAARRPRGSAPHRDSSFN